MLRRRSQWIKLLTRESRGELRMLALKIRSHRRQQTSYDALHKVHVDEWVEEVVQLFGPRFGLRR
jgi:hypothetical protein